MTRHILVVDDNDDVRDVIVGMLIENGFVATAADGGVGMRNVLAAAGGIPIDAIVLDSLMPGEASEALAFHAKTLRLPVVMISDSHESMDFADKHGLQLLRKPFHMGVTTRKCFECTTSWTKHERAARWYVRCTLNGGRSGGGRRHVSDVPRPA